MASLPNELQHSICQVLLTSPDFDVKLMLQLVRINKLWADFVCNHVYRHYRINKYIPFIGFYNTIVSKRPILPYGDYIRSLDLTAINKYGVDKRAHDLIQRCPNLRSITLGHQTSLTPATVQWMARHCKKLCTLSIGALESFPFMLECDFSGLTGLNTMIFTGTPLCFSSLMTLPHSLQELHLVRMEALDTHTMLSFFKHRKGITRLAIHRCSQLLDEMTYWLPLNQLKWLSLAGPDVNDDHVINILSMVGDLDTLALDNTQITTKVLDHIISRSRLQLKTLYLINNYNIARDQQGWIKVA
ncbi:hypothetical protein BC941DRAFT_410606 [Chlamydoabsidia padenii]|nr:hypothetical protein BC941DRAFT_410606 [Chlamydoabsidia padenii]